MKSEMLTDDDRVGWVQENCQNKLRKTRNFELYFDFSLPMLVLSCQHLLRLELGTVSFAYDHMQNSSAKDHAFTSVTLFGQTERLPVYLN